MKFYVLFVLIFLSIEGYSQNNSGRNDLDSIIQKARELRLKRDFNTSITLLDSVRNVLKTRDTLNSVYDKCLFELAKNYYTIGNYGLSESYYKSCGKIREKLYGINSIGYGDVVTNLGIIYHFSGNYKKGLEYYKRALKIRQVNPGQDSKEYASSLHNLGSIMEEMGLLEEATKIYSKSTKLRKEVFGENSIEYVRSLINNGLLEKSKGNFHKADKYFREGINILEIFFPDENIERGFAYLNYSIHLVDIGHIETAKKFNRKAYFNFSKVAGNNHPIIGQIELNYSIILLENREYDKAKSHLDLANNIYEKSFGNNNVKTTKAKLLQINYNLLENNFESADSLCKIFYQNIEAVKKEKDLCYFYGTYAKVAFEVRDTQLSERYFKECYSCLEQTPKDQNYLKLLKDYISFLIRINKKSEALSLSKELIDEKNKYVNKAINFLSVEELIDFINYSKRYSNQFLNIIINSQIHLGEEEKLLGLKELLNLRGFVLENIRKRDLQIKNGGDSLQTIHRELKNIKKKEYELIINNEQKTSLLDILVKKRDSLEKVLIEAIPDFNLEKDFQPLDVIKSKFGNEAGLIVTYELDEISETYIICFHDFMNSSTKYFKVKGIESILNVDDDKNYWFKNDFGILNSYLEQFLEGKSTLIYLPSGIFNKVNFGAMNFKGNPLSFYYDIKQLIGLYNSKAGFTNSGNSDALLFGGLNYDSTGYGHPLPNPEDVITRSLRMFRVDSTNLISNWEYISESKTEVRELSKMLNQKGFSVSEYYDSAGTEEIFKKILQKKHSPRILHFATHGFFFPESETEKNDFDPVFKISEHPMLRSGLILAGANYAWAHGHPKDPNGEDGILTAYEISQMDLSGTELVVLSACETGLGDIKGNEGVYGLQRAFKIAGAKYIIMSLWKVPDFQTRKLMTTFYDYWLNKEMEIPEAFRAAQQKMKEVYEDPYYWAGFILVQ